MLLSNRWCLAQNCPGTGAVTIDTANELTLASQYQPYPTGTPPVLKCYRFAPPTQFAPPYPTVLMVPPNVFRNDKITDDGEPHERHASYDLLQEGFLVFQVETRLAPPGHLPEQLDTDKGYAPEQTDDLKRQILSALADPQCNGNIYLVGGSAGGNLSLWCALDPASTVSGWDETARSHIKAVVSLSGPSQFCDWTNPGNIPSDILTDFEHDLENYVHLPYSIGSQPPCDAACDFAVVNCPLDQASPAWLVTHGATSNPPAFMLYATDGDPVPNSQATDMYNALKGQFPSLAVDKWILHYDYDTSYDHAFKYWPAKNNVTGSDGKCVHQEVINFLTTH
jgi:acetyl esterase/lipase